MKMSYYNEQEVDVEKAIVTPSNLSLERQISLSNGLPDAKTPYTRVNFGIPLYQYNEVPPFLKGNPYIVCGYRAELPAGMCIKSLFAWTNETVNIWTHLVGFLYFLWLCIDDNFKFLVTENGELGDHLTFTCMDISFMTCMFCSSGYHLFNCLSERASKQWLRLDLGGVSVGLCGCYFPGAYYAFYCHDHWKVAYLILLLVMALASMVAQLHPQFLSSQWYWRRLILYSLLIFAGMIPVGHWVVSNGGLYTPLVQVFVPKLAVMYMFAIAGGTFYVTQFPEKKCPGKVDFIGSSHQWWHILVLGGFVWTHHCAIVIFLYWRTHSCDDHFALHQ